MADIQLAPGESFTHIHTVDTVTTLQSGAVEISLNDKKQQLALGKSIQVPAGASHTMKNIGSGPAVCRCMYASG
jgi:quercetin dioxygenase-like cupin family protein